MVNEDTEISRNREVKAKERFEGPEYDSIASAPNIEGLQIWVNGNGPDAAGYYSYVNGQWSGTFGGPNNLPDTELTGGGTVANTEQYNLGPGFTAKQDTNNPKRVILGVKEDYFNGQYNTRPFNSFETEPPRDPQTQPPLSPPGWTFIPDNQSSAQGGWIYKDAPQAVVGKQSFGIHTHTVQKQDGSQVSAGTWAIERGFSLGDGGRNLSLSAWAKVNIADTNFSSGGSHSGETYIGEGDAYFDIRVYDSTLSRIQIPDADRFSLAAGHQHLKSGGGNGTQWVQFGHAITVPDNAAYATVRIQTADASNRWQPLGYMGANAAVKLDAVEVNYTSGTEHFGAIEHTHDGRYLRQSNGSVNQSNLAFDPATQQELNSHASYPSIHHTRYSDSEAVTAVTNANKFIQQSQESSLRVQHAQQAGNAELLDGTSEGAFAKLAQNESIRGNWTFNADLSLGGNHITNLADPNGGQQPVTKSYADSNYLNNNQQFTAQDAIQAVASRDIPGGITVTEGGDSISILPGQANGPTIRVSGSARDIQYRQNIDEWDIEGNPRADGSRILTTADESNLRVAYANNANQLDGTTESEFAKLAEDEYINGSWAFNDVTDFYDNIIIKGRGPGANSGVNIGTGTNGRPYIAPYVDGNNRFGSEFTYEQSNDKWKFETDLELKGVLDMHYNDIKHTPRITPRKNLLVRPDRNPQVGRPLFEVRSSGGRIRLSVDHDGGIETENKFMRLDKNSGPNGARYIFGYGPTMLKGVSGGITAYDVNNNANRLI